ncbi:unnamed protein product [Prorocentrum cordatum]|uniref:Uncharacterized protein n=1 Tax=Prorocentrum cordatum TaxID=2364126 RepID=A0ABN9PG80_9DINO|nr:unnamed protein product [Polarella glacialis]
MEAVPASFAYVVAFGVLQYQQRLPVQESTQPVVASSYTNVQDWLSEGALWMDWVHQGSLVACSASVLVKVNCDVLRNIIVQGGGPMVVCLRCCAILFAHHLEKGARVPSSHLSDVSLPSEHLTAISMRALQFCKLASRTSSGRYTMVSNQSLPQGAPMPWTAPRRTGCPCT